MPGYVIHLAIGKKYIERHKINNEEIFLKGCIEPDLLDKKYSHYGDSSSNPNLQKFLDQNTLNSEYNQGYLLHLITDYLFYNKYLKNFIDNFSKEIYHDYNKINEYLIRKYNVEIPKEIESIVKFENGEPKILNAESICNFIETIANIDYTKIKRLSEYLSEYELVEKHKEETSR